jgi:uncharacterized protein (TIGR01370 family)
MLGLRSSSERGVKWIAFYGWTAPEAVLAEYDLVILDPMFNGAVDGVAEQGATVCGYLSLGEIRSADTWFSQVDPSALAGENPAWPGTWRIDVRSEEWKRVVLEAVIPSIVFKGFNGLMLDTLDTPPYLEALDPDRYGGMRQASIDLVCAIRTTFPDLTLVMNRGYALIGDVADRIDAVMAESLLTSPLEGQPGSFRWNDRAEVIQQLALLSPVTNRAVPILGLEYWNPQDRASIRSLYAAHRQLGHHPYVSTRLLDQIVPEPQV